jgi:transposase
MKLLGRLPSEYSSAERRRQGAITNAGQPHARRAGVEGAGASRDLANGSRHLQRRRATPPNLSQALRWKAQGRLSPRVRRRLARGNQATQVVGASARELVGWRGALANPGAVTPSGAKTPFL